MSGSARPRFLHFSKIAGVEGPPDGLGIAAPDNTSGRDSAGSNPDQPRRSDNDNIDVILPGRGRWCSIRRQRRSSESCQRRTELRCCTPAEQRLSEIEE